MQYFNLAKQIYWLPTQGYGVPESQQMQQELHVCSAS